MGRVFKRRKANYRNLLLARIAKLQKQRAKYAAENPSAPSAQIGVKIETEDEDMLGEERAGTSSELVKAESYKNTDATETTTSTRGPCLICLSENGKGPLRGLFPKERGKEPEEDRGAVYVLEKAMGIFPATVPYLTKLSDGRRPSEWMYFCKSCRFYITEIVVVSKQIQALQTHVDFLRSEVAQKLKKSISKTPKPKDPQYAVTNAIRTLVAKQNNAPVTMEKYTLSKDIQQAVNRLTIKVIRETAVPLTDDEPESEDVEQPMEIKQEVEVESSAFDHDDPLDIHDPCSFEESNDAGETGEKHGGDLREQTAKTQTNAASNVDEYLMKKLFTCPSCLPDPSNANPERQMNIAQFIGHLVFHFDYPLKCSLCGFHLKEDQDEQQKHWQQFHPDMTDVSTDQRFLRVRLSLDALKHFCDNEEDEATPGGSLLCIDCKGPSSTTLDNILLFKVHQALEHPDIARRACPLCLEIVQPSKSNNTNRESIPEDVELSDRRDWLKALTRHLSVNHKGLKLISKLKLCDYCHFCGDMLPLLTGWYIPFGKQIHMIEQHADLVKTSYICTLCNGEYSSLAEFLQHAEAIGEHAEIVANKDAKSIGPLYGENSIKCSLCPKEEAKILTNLRQLSAHLTTSHSLYLKWIMNPLNPREKLNKLWKTVEGHVEDMTRISTITTNKRKVQTKRIDDEEKKIRCKQVLQEYKRKRPPKYVCPSCPALGKMNIDYFITHLLFHWRHPNKCTKCVLYLPVTAEAIHNHWDQLHPEVVSTTTDKHQEVVYSAGKIFECGKCKRLFESLQDRNEHEKRHRHVPNLQPCNICSEGVRDDEELRLHKALAHPNVASVSCYYCDEIYSLESKEGAQYCDYGSLDKHIAEKGDHPEFELGGVSHLFPCDHCGKIIPDVYKTGRRVQKHTTNVHGLTNKETFTCFICNQSVGLSFADHLTNAHAKLVVCDQCGEEVKPSCLPEHSFRKHDIVLEGVTVVNCQYQGCSFKTVNPKRIFHHIKSRHRVKTRSFQCSFCGKAFWNDNNRREHENRHRNKESKPYQCEICGNSFALPNYLYIHKRLSHQGRKFPSTNRKRPRKDPTPPVSTHTQASCKAVAANSMAIEQGGYRELS